MTTMTREQRIAAEIYGYSYANYENHLGIGNVRYDRLMPSAVRVLERARHEAWPLARVAAGLETDEDNARDLLDAYDRAVEVVDADTPAAAFRNAVRLSVEHAVAEGLNTPEAIEKLVTQICYRAADLAYLLDCEGRVLSWYSHELRRIEGSDVDVDDGGDEDD